MGNWTGLLAAKAPSNKFPEPLFYFFPYVDLEVALVKDFPADLSQLLLVWK